MAQIKCGRKFEQFLLGNKAVDPGGPIPPTPFVLAWAEMLRVQISRFDWDTQNPKTPAGQALFQAVAAELPNDAWRNTLELYVAVGLAMDRRHHADCAFLVNGQKRVGIDLTIEWHGYKLANKRRATENSPIPIVVLTQEELAGENGFSYSGREIAAKLMEGSSSHERLLRQIRDHDHNTVRRSMRRRRR